MLNQIRSHIQSVFDPYPFQMLLLLYVEDRSKEDVHCHWRSCYPPLSMFLAVDIDGQVRTHVTEFYQGKSRFCLIQVQPGFTSGHALKLLLDALAWWVLGRTAGHSSTKWSQHITTKAGRYQKIDTCVQYAHNTWVYRYIVHFDLNSSFPLLNYINSLLLSQN